MVMHLSQADHDRVSEAVARAEQASDGEIVTIVASRSDSYRDVAFAWAALAMLAVPPLLAALPGSWIDRAEALVLDWDQDFTRGALMATLTLLLAAVFLIVRLTLSSQKLRLALTPAGIKARRVHQRAVELFRSGCEARTTGRTGILIYLSLAEHRAEIVADRAIASQVEPEAWGEAMAAMIDEVKAGKPGEGMALAVARVGEVLARILPASGLNPNELCDRLVEL
ncbi:MAG: TPM domain-containing protein [Sphingosinicella sp.]